MQDVVEKATALRLTRGTGYKHDGLPSTSIAYYNVAPTDDVLYRLDRDDVIHLCISDIRLNKADGIEMFFGTLPSVKSLVLNKNMLGNVID